MPNTILVGTKKGLFLVHGDESRTKWEAAEPLLEGWEVMHAILHDGVLYAATGGMVYSPTVQRSQDFGKSWELAETIGLPEETGEKVQKLWHIEPGHEGELWLGGAPAVLFKSTDGGVTWEANQGLLEHPTRGKWQPGAGGLTCHSIQLDPTDRDRIYIGISAVGTWRSDDGGKSWQPKNKNVWAGFNPENEYPEWGQCVHKLLLHRGKEGRLWQQNHCGVYRTDDGMETWERLDENGLPSDFGFPLMLDPHDPDAAYVIPQIGAENRVTCDGRLGVYRTRDAGASWELASNGLPEQAYVSLYREASAFDSGSPAGLYFGTHQGVVYASPDAGDTWVEAASELPPVFSVEVAEWPS